MPQTGDAVNVFGRLLLHRIHNVVDGDAAQQTIFAVHDAHGHQVVLVKQARDLFLVHIHGHAGNVPVDHVHDGREAAGRNQALQRNGADKTLLLVDNENIVDVFNFVLGAGDGLEGVVDGGRPAHRHQLRLHDAAGRVLGVAQEFLDFLGLRRLDRVEHGLGLVVGQFGDDVRPVVGLHLFDDVRELFVGEILDDLFPGRVGKLQDNVGRLVHVQKGKQMQAVFLVEFVDEFGDVRRMHVGEEIDDVELAVAADQLLEGRQRGRFFFLDLRHGFA